MAERSRPVVVVVLLTRVLDKLIGFLRDKVVRVYALAKWEGCAPSDSRVVLVNIERGLQIGH